MRRAQATGGTPSGSHLSPITASVVETMARFPHVPVKANVATGAGKEITLPLPARLRAHRSMHAPDSTIAPQRTSSEH